MNGAELWLPQVLNRATTPDLTDSTAPRCLGHDWSANSRREPRASSAIHRRAAHSRI